MHSPSERVEGAFSPSGGPSRARRGVSAGEPAPGLRTSLTHRESSVGGLARDASSGYNLGVAVLVGTSGWQYSSWRGRFYPEGVPQRAWLRFFAERFPTVEVNNSFYMLPKATSFERWRDETPEGFVVTVKANRYITHIRRLRDCRDAVQTFWGRARLLGPKLGPVLFQLPPRFAVDPDLLRDFLGVLPEGIRAAFEFRDRSWERDEVYELLDRAGAAFVLADRPAAHVPDVVTGGWSYVRFHEGRPGVVDYPREKLRRWASRIRAMPARDTFVYFNNDPGGAAVRDATTLTAMLRGATAGASTRSA
jgi:uncharacterized protein YecE (DUF72 family)